MTEWKAPAPDAKDPAGEREETELYADLGDSLQTWAHSWPSAAQAREAGRGGSGGRWMSQAEEVTGPVRMPNGAGDYLRRGTTLVELAEAETSAAAGDWL